MAAAVESSAALIATSCKAEVAGTSAAALTLHHAALGGFQCGCQLPLEATSAAPTGTLNKVAAKTPLKDLVPPKQILI